MHERTFAAVSRPQLACGQIAGRFDFKNSLSSPRSLCKNAFFKEKNITILLLFSYTCMHNLNKLEHVYSLEIHSVSSIKLQNIFFHTINRQVNMKALMNVISIRSAQVLYQFPRYFTNFYSQRESNGH